MLDRTHTHVADAERRRDPTGTGDIRSRFRSDMRQRWTRMRRLVREAVVDHDMLGLGPTSVESISTVAQGGDVIRGFQMWLDEALKQVVLGGDGSWTRPYVQETAARAEARAHRLVGWQGASATHYSADALQAAVVVELQGVAEAVSQQVMRVAASAVLAKVKPTVAARQALDRIEAVGKTRARMVAETSIVQAFNHATLDVFQALGLRNGELLVGVADVIESPGWPEDAASVADWVEALSSVGNDLEAPAMRIQPAISEVLSALHASEGALLARMSGSGATCFAIYPDRGKTQAAAEKIRREHPHWWVHAGVLS